MNRDSHSKTDKFTCDFYLAAIYTALAKTLLKPFRTIRYERNTYIKKAYNTNNYNFPQHINNMIRERGISALWKNNIADILHSAPMIAFHFALNELYKNLLNSFQEKKSSWKSSLVSFISGGLAGVTVLACSSPFDIAKTHMSIQAIKTRLTPEPEGIPARLQEMYRNKEIRRYYKGFSLSSLRAFLYRACYFGGYDTLKQIFSSEGREINGFTKFIFARTVVAFASLVVYPLDVVWYMMGTRSLVSNEPYHKEAIKCIQKALKKDGAQIFIRGIWRKSIRAPRALESTLVLVWYDQSQRGLAECLYKYHNSQNFCLQFLY